MHDSDAQTECTAYDCTNDAVDPAMSTPLCDDHQPEPVDPADFQPRLGSLDADRWHTSELGITCIKCGSLTTDWVPVDPDTWGEHGRVRCPECEIGRELHHLERREMFSGREDPR